MSYWILQLLAALHDETQKFVHELLDGGRQATHRLVAQIEKIDEEWHEYPTHDLLENDPATAALAPLFEPTNLLTFRLGRFDLRLDFGYFGHGVTYSLMLLSAALLALTALVAPHEPALQLAGAREAPSALHHCQPCHVAWLAWRWTAQA